MNLPNVTEIILSEHEKMPNERSLLVGISGIDASGKGFIMAKLADDLRRQGFKVAGISVDGWLNLPHVRFDKNNPAQNFYENAIRFREMFETLILPLRKNRSVNLTADYAEETAAEFKRHEYNFEDIDIILLEGIFLFKNNFCVVFDLRIWIECSFETALKRAIARSQEGLSAKETVRAYETIYFPAQKIHFERDEPRKNADLVWGNL